MSLNIFSILKSRIALVILSIRGNLSNTFELAEGACSKSSQPLEPPTPHNAGFPVSAVKMRSKGRIANSSRKNQVLKYSLAIFLRSVTSSSPSLGGRVVKNVRTISMANIVSIITKTQHQVFDSVFRAIWKGKMMQIKNRNPVRTKSQ